MSINWVMLSPETNPPFTPLPNERVLLISPKRISLNIQTPAHYPARQQQAFSLTHGNGVLYLTNQRIIYLPDKPSEQLKSFASMILKLHDSHVTYPLFGSNAWIALCQPVQGGGISIPSTGVVELKFTFKDGGVSDFHSKYEQVRERLLQAVEASRMAGGDAGSSRGSMNGVDVTNVNLEDLPAYSEESDGPLISPIAASIQAHTSPGLQHQRVDIEDDRHRRNLTENASGPPDEPPPGYEEAQVAGLQAVIDQHSTRER